MKIPAVLASTLALLTAAPAHADRWTPATVQRAITTADQHWPNSPCLGHHEITWERGADLDPNTNILARSDTGPRLGCHVAIAWDRIDQLDHGHGPWLCTILEHEFGHNAGHWHSPDPRDVMYPQPRVTPDCRAAFARPASWRWTARPRWHWR